MSPYHALLMEPPRPNTSSRGCPRWCWCAPTGDDVSQVACPECLLEGGGDADSVDDEVCAAGDSLTPSGRADPEEFTVGYAAAKKLILPKADGDDGGGATELVRLRLLR